ncbi:MAG: hypothetical protein K8M05_40590 [Deltaproteobacteria bacterium]|nr:hypothetical protein [Kofleriaceae bacterium]
MPATAEELDPRQLRPRHGVDDPARLRALAAAGVDGVFANDPRAAIAVLDGRDGPGGRQAE